MAKFIELTALIMDNSDDTLKHQPLLLARDDIESVVYNGTNCVIEMQTGGHFEVLEDYESIKRKLIPVEEPVHSGPGG
jgi:hypothetical protein